jgi:hypothetical protein
MERIEKQFALDLVWKKWVYEAIEKATKNSSNVA